MLTSARVRVFVALLLLAATALLGAQQPPIEARLEGLRRLHGAGSQGLERPRHRRRHRRQGQAGLRQGIRLSGLRQEAPVHARHDPADRVEHEALHGGGRRPAGRRRQARLGQADPAVRAGHQVLQRRSRPHDHGPRHALAPHRHHAPRSHLVQVGLLAEGAVRAAPVPRALRAAALSVPLQQHDVRGRGLLDRAAVRQDVGGVRSRSHSHAARHDEHDVRHRGDAQDV